MVVDNTRHLLYALVYFTNDDNSLFDTNTVIDSMVTVYDLGECGTGFQKIGEIVQATVKKSFFEQNQSIRKENNFVIMDIYPITRRESKYFNLVIVTKNGVRAYVSFDTYYSKLKIEKEVEIEQYDHNKICRLRPSMKYTMVIKSFAEPSNSTVIEDVDYNSTLRELQKTVSYNQIFYIDNKFLICYKDDFRSKAYIDVIEFDSAASIRQEWSLPSDFKSREIISNVIKFNFTKEIYSIQKLPQGFNTPFDMTNMLKSFNYENNIPRNTNFLDSNYHYSFSCMHPFATQMFSSPEEFMVMTSSELIYIAKLRPIDVIFNLLTSDLNQVQYQEQFSRLVAENGLNETAFMLLNIMCNMNMIFYRKLDEDLMNTSDFGDNKSVHNKSSNMLMMDNNETKNNERLVDKATEQYIRLIDFTLKSKEPNTKNEKRQNVSNYRMTRPNTIGEPLLDVQTTKSNCKFINLFSLILLHVYVSGENC